jgi:hypothetical protein
MRGLSKDPRQRYVDTVTFARELDSALAAVEEPIKPGLLSRVKDIFKL